MESESSSLSDISTAISHAGVVPQDSSFDNDSTNRKSLSPQSSVNDHSSKLQPVSLKKIKWKTPEVTTSSPGTEKEPAQQHMKIKVKPSSNSSNQDQEKFLEENNEDIIENSITIALTDPITKSKMLTPVRTTKCAHIDSFDLDSFFALHNISKVKLKSRRIKTDLSLLKKYTTSLLDRLNPYLSNAPAKKKHEIVNKTEYVMLKLENKHMGRDNNNLRYFTCPICDKEFDVLNELYSVDFLQEIIVELNNTLIIKDAPKTFVDVLTNRKHDLKEVTHVVINRDGTYNYHVEDKYRESLELHELVELPDDEEEYTELLLPLPIPEFRHKKRRKITIEVSDSESWSDLDFNTKDDYDAGNGNQGDMGNPILIDD